MEEDKVHLVRRYSGGGAVYQDLGNGIWTFLAPRNFHDVARNMAIVTEAIRKLGANAEPTGRNDITVGGRKVEALLFCSLAKIINLFLSF